MLMRWLEPMIEKRIDETAEICDNNPELNGLYDRIIGGWEDPKIDNSPNQLCARINDIETTINARTRKVIEMSYRLGFGDGLAVKTEIKKCL